MYTALSGLSLKTVESILSQECVFSKFKHSNKCLKSEDL